MWQVGTRRFAWKNKSDNWVSSARRPKVVPDEMYVLQLIGVHPQRWKLIGIEGTSISVQVEKTFIHCFKSKVFSSERGVFKSLGHWKNLLESNN